MQTQFCKQTKNSFDIVTNHNLFLAEQRLYCLKHKEHCHFCCLNSISVKGQDSSVGRVSDQYRHWVQFPVQQQGTFLSVNFQCWFSYHVPGCKTSSYLLTYHVCTAPLCDCIDICVHIKNPKHWQPCHCLDTQKYVLHMLAGTGSAALAAYVALSW